MTFRAVPFLVVVAALSGLGPAARAQSTDEPIARRAADERLLLTATPLTLEKGRFLLTNDEGLLFRIGAGLTQRTQIDLWAGGFPIPAAGAGVLPFMGAGAGAG